jgi:hypothetical protein
VLAWTYGKFESIRESESRLSSKGKTDDVIVKVYVTSPIKAWKKKGKMRLEQQTFVRHLKQRERKHNLSSLLSYQYKGEKNISAVN